MKRKISAFFLILAMLWLSGCSVSSLDPENLMRTPEPSGENSGLNEAIEKAAGANYTLKTPKTGEYRSAYILKDLDFDGEKEAIAFYKTQTDKMNIGFVYMKRIDGVWTAISKFDGFGTDIYNVEFANISGDDNYEIVLSWDSFDGKDKILTVFEIIDGAPVNIFQTNYTAYKILEMDGNSGQEILTVTLSSLTEERTSVARLYSYRDNAVNLIGNTKLDSSVSSFAAINYDPPTEDTPTIVYIDAYVSQTDMITEVLYWDEENNVLQAPFNNKTTGKNDVIWRNTAILTADINSDGYLEIPCGVSGMSSGDSSIVVWNRYTSDGLEGVKYTFVNYVDGYMFILPERWINSVAIVSSTDDRRRSFYIWDSYTYRSGTLLLQIDTSLVEGDLDTISQGFMSIGQNNGYYYYAKIYDVDNEAAITIEEVKDSLIYLE